MSVPELPLLTQWVVPGVTAVTCVVSVVAVARRPSRWVRRWLPMSLVGGALILTAVVTGFRVAELGTAGVPLSLWCAAFAAGAALPTAILGSVQGRWWQRVSAVATVPATLVVLLLVANLWTGYFSTTTRAWEALTGETLQGQITASDLDHLRGDPPTTGRILSLPNPNGPSSFTHRTEYAYIPPNWFRDPQRPLRAIIMIGGVLTTTTDWIRSGDATRTADRYERATGRSPILVFVDPTGRLGNDTECVDSPRGRAESHIIDDVLPWVSNTLASGRHVDVAVAGWSMGGTCAMTLALRHPERFRGFASIQGDLRPDVGGRQRTIDELHGGSTRRWFEHDPLTMLRDHQRYRGMFAWFAAPGSGPPQRCSAGGRDECRTTLQLADAARAAGLRTSVTLEPGRHDWPFAARGFSRALPRLIAQMHSGR